jgi:aldehyde dehydrogenase (NAD+)
MHIIDHHYISGQWVAGTGDTRQALINPATEQVCARITLGTAADLDAAVAAAAAARPGFADTSPAERAALLRAIMAAYAGRLPQIAAAITEEMGCPTSLSRAAQAAIGLGHLQAMIAALESFSWEETHGRSQLVYEPVGIAGLITPWNWPMNQIVAKVAAALAAGCTMILKPSELAPLSAQIFAEIIDSAGVPAGVFNLVHGDGAGVGTAMARHPGIDMISFTGSTRAGVAIAREAAETVKRVHQELGGKSPNIIFDDADFDLAITTAVRTMMINSGQSCNAPSRLLVPRDRLDETIAAATAAARSIAIGDPMTEGAHIGPLANVRQYEKVRAMIAQGVAEGAILIAGGLDAPTGQTRGYFVAPTIFAGVTADMAIAREEIFGPVLVILTYVDEADAIRIANDTVYGLSAYLWTGAPERAQRVARRLRAGNVHVNGGGIDVTMPFGGYKQSGNGREFGAHGLREFLEAKAILNPA